MHKQCLVSWYDNLSQVPLRNMLVNIHISCATAQHYAILNYKNRNYNKSSCTM